MCRKNYTSVEQLFDDLDNETILTEDEDFLSDDDLALLLSPKPPAKPRAKRKPTVVKKTPAPKKRVKAKK